MTKLTVFNLEFDIFDGSAWENVTINITAETKIQLMKTFLNEVRCMHEQRAGETRRQSIKRKWNDNKRFITTDILTFPIVTVKSRR